MAIDEALLLYRFKNPDSLPVFRIYSWRPSAFSLGYFQEPTAILNLSLVEKERVNWVRRITGGGVIFHNEEITYSIILYDEELPLKTNVKESYKILVSFLMEFYRRLNLKPYFAKDFYKNFISLGKFCAFCFSGLEEHDIVIEGKKIGGNAQRRKRHLILQHGSIPLNIKFEEFSKYIIVPIQRDRIGYLFEFIDSQSINTLKELLKECLEDSLKMKLISSSLNKEEQDLTEYLFISKYSTKEWNYFRKFTAEFINFKNNEKCFSI